MGDYNYIKLWKELHRNFDSYVDLNLNLFNQVYVTRLQVQNKNHTYSLGVQ